MVDLIGEVLLALLGQEVQPSPADDLTDHIQVPADAAVHIIHDDALLSHVVLDDHDAIGSQAGTAPLQEVREVVVSEVSWGAKQVLVSAGPPGSVMGEGRLWSGSLLIQADKYLSSGKLGDVQLTSHGLSPSSVQPTPLCPGLRVWREKMPHCNALPLPLYGSGPLPSQAATLMSTAAPALLKPHLMHVGYMRQAMRPRKAKRPSPMTHWIQMTS